MSKLRVVLLGSVRIVYDEVPQDAKVTRTLQALLAFLLLQRHHSHPRDVLAGLFWGECSEERARNCLSTALWRLRRVLEPAGVSHGTYLVTTPQGEIGFNDESDYWLDVNVFEEQARATLALPVEACRPPDIEGLERAISLYTGELLNSYYDDWVLHERERLRLLYLNGLTHLMRYYHRHGQYEQGLVYGREILHHDPLREEVHREVMRLYLANGQRTMALQQYETCRQALADELGISPLVETQEAHAQILASSRHAVPPIPVPAPATEAGGLQPALRQLGIAMQSFETARDQLQRAIQIVERFAERDEDGHEAAQ